MTTFERVYDKKKLNEIKKLLKSGNVTIDSWVEKAKYSKSRLFEFVKLEDMNNVTKKVLKKYQESSVTKDEKKLKIEYYIYENDVDDPGKKTKRSKLYAGYVVFRFISDNELIYQVQVDFMDKKGLDIPNSIECAIKSFITI